MWIACNFRDENIIVRNHLQMYRYLHIFHFFETYCNMWEGHKRQKFYIYGDKIFNN
jgi:hypothetical protein